MATEFVDLEGSARAAAPGAQRVGDADSADLVEVTVTLRGPQLPAPDPATGAVTAEALTAQFTASPQDAETVTGVLQSFGLEVYDVAPATRSLHARGTVAQMDAAFDVKLGLYQTTSTGEDDAADVVPSGRPGEFRGREGSIRIPESLAGIVTGVFGLDDRRMARRRSAATGTTTPAALGPVDLETRYAFPAGQGAGQHVAIAEFGGAFFASDVQAFCTKYGRPTPTVTPVSAGYPILTLAQIRALPQDEQEEVLEESVEVMMDVEIIAALCPQAAITVYFAQFNQKGWIDLLNDVLGAGVNLPVTLSISWGLAEDSPSWSSSAVKEINLRLQAVSLLGVTVCVSAGDDGAGDQIHDGRAHVNFPASSPFVLSVGGTELDGTPAEEVVWWDSPGERTSSGGGATGGGVSTVFARPTWQNVTVPSLNAGSIDGRVLPDVAALAGEPLYDLIFLGQDSPNGGTSASAPLWAALLARIAATLPAASHHRFVTPLLYADAADGTPVGSTGCADITQGDNHSPGVDPGYAAGTGFDAVSGWGIPIGTSLQALLS